MQDAAAAVRAEPLWIVLTPSIDEEGWRHAIAQGVARAGLTLRDALLEQPASTNMPEREVWLTNDCEVVASLGRIPAAVIVPRPETASIAVTTLQGLQPPHNMSQASMLIARALAQDPRRTAVITADDIRRQGARPFVLAEGLEVTAPASAGFDGDAPAIMTAFAVFETTPPGPGDTLDWGETLFRYDAPASRGAQRVGELDITGRPRILVYGPYFALHRGRWQARIRFLVDATAASKEYRFDWGTPHDFQTAAIVPPHSGVFEIDLTHDFKSVDYGELRLWLMEGSFDGVLHFMGARLTYVGR